ncbi:hypothetical protein D3C85_1925870 [compost metagenome]
MDLWIVFFGYKFCSRRLRRLRRFAGIFFVIEYMDLWIVFCVYKFVHADIADLADEITLICESR